jgi:murein DD-endopeptidase MepM/ murein hydrolase activator NlpD
MAAFRRLFAAFLAVAFAMLPAVRAGASTADDLDAARARLADARAAANAAAADFAAARDKLGATQNHIAQVQATIDADKSRAATLQSVVSARALYAYTHAGQNLEVVIGADDAITALRRQELLDHANQTDNSSIKKLAAINADLKEQQTALQKEEATQQQAADTLDAKQRDLEAKLADAQQATAALQAKLDQEIAVAAAAEQARLAAERAQLQAAQPAQGGGAPGQIINNPVVGGFMCPVAGAAYSDDYGGPTGHPGIDMFVPIGTPVVAVKSGSVWFVPNEGAGGNDAYLNASDGNTYFMAHLSSFVGGARSVAQGELIAYSGMTGNATAPHLHFEIRIGGPNGGRVDPYPTLKSAGC